LKNHYHHSHGIPKSLQHFLAGQIAELAYQQALRIARAISISSITASVEGAFPFLGPPGELLQTSEVSACQPPIQPPNV